MVLSGIISAVVSLFIAASSVGIDMDYEGEVDVYSGSPINSEDGVQQQTVNLAGGGIYNRGSHMFVYTVPGGNQSVSSSIADGMITTKKVSLEYDNGLVAALYRDGKTEEGIDIKNITKAGKYALVVSGANVDHQLLSFTIVPQKTGLLNSYKLPLGFDLRELSINGVKQEFKDVSTVDMSIDGEYIITYRCNLTGIDYGLNLSIDHTPPAVTFEGINNGKARGPVTIKDISRGDKVSILCDGEAVHFPEGGVLTMPGKYEVSVADDAGNIVFESFEIKFYLNNQGLWFGILIIAVIASAIVYMVLARKKLRVR